MFGWVFNTKQTVRREEKGPFYPSAIDLEMTIFIRFEVFKKIKPNFSDESDQNFARKSFSDDHFSEGLFSEDHFFGDFFSGVFLPGDRFSEHFFWGFFSTDHFST